MSVARDWSISRRQPAAAIFVVLHKVLVQLFRVLWPFLLIQIFRSKKPDSSSSVEYWILGFSILVFLVSLIEYWFFRFSIPGNELIVKRGLFVKRNIVLPLHKIQAIHIQQNWLQRLLNLSQVSFDSPGSKNAEVKITMHKDDAYALRNFVLGTTAQASQEGPIQEKTETIKPEPIKSRPFYEMEPYDLLKLGISANHLEAFFILLAFGFSVLDDIELAIGQQYEGAMKWISDQAASDEFSAIVIFGAIVLAISVAVSFVRIVLKYANFRISKTDKGFQVQSGLINSNEKLIPFRKIQYISWKANWVRKKIGFHLLEFHSIGTLDTKRKWEIKIPLPRMVLLPKLLENYHSAISSNPSSGISKHYILRRVLFLGILPALLLAFVTYFWIGTYSLWFFLLIGYAWLSAWRFQTKFRFFIHKDAIQIYRSIWGQETILLQWSKIQSVKIRQSLFQRRRELASVHLYTSGGVIIIPFIKLQQAHDIKNYALYVVESQNSGSGQEDLPGGSDIAGIQ